MVKEALGIAIGFSIKGLSEVKMAQKNVSGLKQTLSNIKSNIKLDFAGGVAKAKELKNELLNLSSLAAGSALVMPIKTAIDYESAMADVKKVVDFSSKAEFDSFSDSLLKLSRSIPLSASELASITASGGQLGIAKENLLDFTQIVAKMSTAFDMSASDAGESIASMMNVYKLGINEVKALGDTINHLSDNSAAKASKIVETMKRIGGSAKVFGLSENSAAALASSFIALGKSPEVAATSINALLNKLGTAEKQGTKFSKALQSLGMDSNYLKHMIKANPQKAINEFLASLEAVDSGEKMGVLTDLFGAEYSDDIALVVSNLNEYKKALKLANDEAKKGSMDREFASRSATTANALQVLKNAVNELGINFGSTFLPAISAVIKGISSFIGAITNFLNSNQTLKSIISWVVAGFVGFNIVVTTLRLAVVGLGGTYRSFSAIVLFARNALNLKALSMALVSARLKAAIVLTSAYTAISKLFAGALTFLRTGLIASAGALKILRLALISTGIGAIVVGLGMAANYLIENWDKVKAFFTSFWQSIKPYWDSVASFFSGVWESIKAVFAPVYQFFNSIFAPVADFLGSLFSPIVEFWKGTFGGFFSWISDKLGWVSSAIGSVAEFLGFGNKDEIKAPAKAKDVSNYYKPNPSAQAITSSGTAINVSFNGDFNIATSDGKFDLESFKVQVVSALRQAISKEAFNRANTAYSSN